MKKVLFWLFAIVILLPGSALAQQPPISKATTNPGTTPAKPSTPAVIPTGRVAVIDTTQFPKGILEYKKELDKLEAEFQPRTKELETLKTRLDALQKELENAPMMKPEVQQQKVAEYESIKKEAQRKFEDYQTDVGKRSGAVLAPLNEKISRFLQGYATSHNIVVVFDMSQNDTTRLFLAINPDSNVTDDFMKEYNKSNPVAAAPPSPAPNK